MQNVPIISTLLLGLFGIFGVEASEQQILALVTGLATAVSAAWAIWQGNRK